MSTPSERIRGLVRDGKIPAAEGERLLSALEARPRPSWRLLYNPFERIGGGAAVGYGFVLAAVSFPLARLGVRFDGFFDLHVGKTPSTFRTFVIEQLAAWLLPSLLFWGYGFVLRWARWIDVLGVIMFARAPLVLAALPLVLLTPLVPEPPTPHLGPVMAVIVTIALVAIGWHVTLLYQGFKNATGLVGPKLVAGFVALAVLSEIASKLAIALASR